MSDTSDHMLDVMHEHLGPEALSPREWQQAGYAARVAEAFVPSDPSDDDAGALLDVAVDAGLAALGTLSPAARYAVSLGLRAGLAALWRAMTTARLIEAETIVVREVDE